MEDGFGRWRLEETLGGMGKPGQIAREVKKAALQNSKQEVEHGQPRAAHECRCRVGDPASPG